MTQGTDFFVIGQAYDGTDAPLPGSVSGAAFIYDGTNGRLYHDDNVEGADAAPGDGYSVVADVQDGTGNAAALNENDIGLV